MPSSVVLQLEGLKEWKVETIEVFKEKFQIFHQEKRHQGQNNFEKYIAPIIITFDPENNKKVSLEIYTHRDDINNTHGQSTKSDLRELICQNQEIYNNIIKMKFLFKKW